MSIHGRGLRWAPIATIALMYCACFFGCKGSNDSAVIESAEQELADAMQNARSTEEVDAVVQDLVDDSTGIRKQAALLMKQFTEKSTATSAAFQNAFAPIEDPIFFDYSRLSSPGEFEHRKKTLLTYIEAAKTYFKSTNEGLTRLENQLLALGSENKFITETVKGLRIGTAKQKPTFGPLMETHQQFGEACLNIFEFLETRRSKWDVAENGSMEFTTDEDIDAFNNLNNRMINQMKELNQRLIAQQNVIQSH